MKLTQQKGMASLMLHVLWFHNFDLDHSTGSGKILQREECPICVEQSRIVDAVLKEIEKASTTK
jgi:hypothetical protein